MPALRISADDWVPKGSFAGSNVSPTPDELPTIIHVLVLEELMPKTQGIGIRRWMQETLAKELVNRACRFGPWYGILQPFRQAVELLFQ